MTDAVKRAKELLDQLPPGPWAVEGTSASRANVVDAKGNWIADIRKDFSEDDQPSLIELRNEVLPALVAEVERLNKALTEAEIDTHDARGKVADQDERIAELHRQREEALAEVERYRSAVLPEKVAEIDGRYRELAERIANARKIMDCDASDREGQLRARDAIQFVFSKETTAYCDCVTLLDAVHALTVNAGLSAIRIRQLQEQLASCEKALGERDARILELTGAFKWTVLVGFRCQHCANTGERKTYEIEVADTRIGKRYICKICGAGGMMSDHDAPVAQVPEWRALSVLDAVPPEKRDCRYLAIRRGVDDLPEIGAVRWDESWASREGRSSSVAWVPADDWEFPSRVTGCRFVDSEGVPVPWDRVGL